MNLFSGSIGVVFAMSGRWFEAFIMIIVAAIFDFFDGLAARALKVSSPIGKDLDSLADMVSFGFLPGAIIYQMLRNSYDLPLISYNEYLMIPFIGFVVTLFSALRLAKFNNDSRQTSSFIGLPTPANAIFFGGWSLMTHYICNCTWLGKIVDSHITILSLTLVFSYLLVAELPLFSLKFKNLSFKDNFYKYLLVIGAIALMIMFYKWIYMAVPLVIVLYILLSVVQNITTKSN